MLKALYDYAIQHNLVLPPGFSKKPIKAWISLSTKSNFVGVEPGDDYSYMIPDIGSMANGTEKSNVLVEKRLVKVGRHTLPRVELMRRHSGEVDDFLIPRNDT